MMIRKEARKRSLPVFFGYLFLGFASGVLLQQAGLNFIETGITAAIVYAGTGQFMLASFLAEGVSLFTAVFTTFMVNSRHIFYGISYLEEFRSIGDWRYPYMIFTLTDETYSVLSMLKGKENAPELMYYISKYHHSYWIFGCVVGALGGTYLPVNLTGVDFAMTALFIILLMERIDEGGQIPSCLIGFFSAVVSYLLLGKERFLFPAFLLALFLLIWRGERRLSHE